MRLPSISIFPKSGIQTLQNRKSPRCKIANQNVAKSQIADQYAAIMSAANYRPRLLDSLLAAKLRATGGVLLCGARAAGKTTTALHRAASSVRLDRSENLRQLAALAPAQLLAGDAPRLVDEWQLAPSLWNAARCEIDERGAKGQFIFTGSAAPDDDASLHSGAGRFARLVLRPMTLGESGDSTGSVSFAALFGDTPTPTAGSVPNGGVAGFGGADVPRYAELIVRGGWPALRELSADDAHSALRDYVDNVAEVDLRNLASPPDPQRMAALLRAISRNVSSEASLEKLAREADFGNGAPAAQTVRKYLDQLARCFVLEELPAWNTTIRSSIRLRVKPKWHFCDPSLACAALGVTAGGLLNDLETMGLLFESMAVRDLRSLADAADAKVFHYRDSSDLEIDAIVERRDGAWLAFEIKLGGEKAIETAVASFAKLRNRLLPEKLANLRACCVLTAGETSFTRPDGIHVIALGHLN